MRRIDLNIYCLYIGLLALTCLILSPLAVDADYYVSHPSHIPYLDNFSTPVIKPGENGILSFTLKNRYNGSMERVVLTMEICQYVTIEISKNILAVSHPPMIIAAKTGGRCAVHTVTFELARLDANTTVDLWFMIATSTRTPEGTYLVRSNLTFVYEGTEYTMKSRAHFSSEEWMNYDTGEEAGGNLSALNCDGIIPDTSFRVREPISMLWLYVLIGITIFFACLALVFYLMDERGMFPRAKRKLDIWGKKLRRTIDRVYWKRV